MTAFIYIAALFCGALVSHYVIAFSIKKAKQHSLVNRWVLALLFAVKLPSQVALWLGSILISYDVLSQIYGMPSFGSFITLQKMVTAIPFLWFLFKLRASYERLAIELHKRKEVAIDPTLLSVVSKLSTAVLVLFSVITVLHIMGIPLQSLMIFGGAVSIAVGLAAQNVIANFFGGMMVYINRPFKVGDWIKSPDKEIEGTVEAIGWYSTRIRTFERKILHAPNSLFTQIVLQNPSQMYNRRIRPTIGLRYEDIDKVELVVNDIELMLQQHPDIDQEQHLMVHWVEFGEYSLDIDVYTFTKTTDWKTYRKIQQDIFLKIMKIVDKHGAEVAFPTRISLRQDIQ